MMGREYHRNYSRMYYHKRMSEIKDRLGGKCTKCGSTEKLELHHTDPSTKKYDISKKVLSVRKSELDIELKKCTLLCHKCHKQISDEQLSDMMKTRASKIAMVRPVVCIEDDIEFSSITECAKHYCTTVDIIQRVCSGKRNTWHDKHFVYNGDKRSQNS